MDDIKSKKREEILGNLILVAKQCQTRYAGRKELATEGDDVTALLLETLEEAFTYGLKQPIPIARLQDMVSSNKDFVFWEFCQEHLTNHERERFNSLKHASTNRGKIKAFIRASLNESSLRRYILMWLDDPRLFNIYESWSLMRDPEATNLLPSIASGLSTILFALAIDTPNINLGPDREVIKKPEPIIHAPAPVGSLKKIAPIERPIASPSENDTDKFNPFNEVKQEASDAVVETLDVPTDSTADQSEYEPEYLEKIPQEMLNKNFDHEVLSDPSEAGSDDETDSDVRLETKSEVSSQYSKSSSAVSSASAYNRHSTLELMEKLQEMTERCIYLQTQVTQLSQENRQLRRLTDHFVPESVANFFITIPQAQLCKGTHRSYYSYQIHVTMREDLISWVVMRRYREFYKLHKYLKSLHPQVSAMDFPPKKRFGNMNRIFVEERRQQLQIYLMNVIECLPHVEECRCKDDLQKVFPFFKER